MDSLPIISSTGFLLGAGAMYFSVWYLKRVQKKKELKEKEISYFINHFIFYGAFLFGMGIIPLLGFQNKLALQLTFPLSSIFWYIGYAFLIYTAASYRFVSLQKSLVGLVLIAGAAVTILLFLNPSNTVVEKGITLWGFQPPATFFVPLFMMTFMVLIMLGFLYESFKNPDQIIRRRSLFWALSLFVGIFGGPLHAIVKTSFQYLLLDIILVASYFLRLAGAIYKR